MFLKRFFCPRLSDCYCLFSQDIVIAELISRAAKHLFKSFMQGVDMMSLSSAVSHFLNCYLGSFPSPHAQVTAEEVRFTIDL